MILSNDQRNGCGQIFIFSALNGIMKLETENILFFDSFCLSEMSRIHNTLCANFIKESLHKSSTALTQAL